MVALSADYQEIEEFLETTRDNTGKCPNIVNQNMVANPKNNPLSMKYLAFAWDVSKNRPRAAYLELVEQEGKSAFILNKELVTGYVKPPQEKNLNSVIDCRVSAWRIYTPERMFIKDRMKKYVNQHVVVT